MADCDRCTKTLVGRQKRWCSVSCRVEFGNELRMVEGVETLTRQCKVCGFHKPLAVDFYQIPGSGSYRRECRACTVDGNKDRHELAPEKKRRTHLKGLYNITPEEYEEILKAQGGVCATCLKPPTRQRLCVDHDHRTKQVRGLLCGWCNLRLIAKAHDAAVFRRAAEYLENHPAEAVIGVRLVPANRPKKKRAPRKRIR